MSDALPLPPRSRLEQYKKLAKELVEINPMDDAAAMQQWATRWLESLAKAMNLDSSEPEVRNMIQGGIEWLCRTWKDRGTLAEAQFFIAKAHGFESWPKFAKHVQSLERTEGSLFEQAADAIVTGDIERLRAILRENPRLVFERSERDHHSTLLHYTAANGIEDFRQKTPPNIVDITRLLLDAGAEVDAESDAYSGRSTTLELAATSVHPENTGVQEELLAFLLERGARIDGVRGDSIVNACLANGRGAAAEFLAGRGAKIDLEGAAGIGRLDLVQTLLPDAPREKMLRGLAMACEFDYAEVVTFLLDHGAGVGERLRNGEIALHWAAYEGHAGIVKLLLDRGSPLDVKDGNFEGTPLDWAFYGWAHIDPKRVVQRQHHEAVALLARAGAKLDPGWYADQPGLLEKVRADSRFELK